MLSGPPINLLESLDRVDDAIDANADLADRMLEAAVMTFPVNLEMDPSSSVGKSPAWYGTATSLHLDKARSTIRQMYRDWSAEGAAERHACYDPIFQDLELEFSHVLDKGSVRVLVPGAGLGRLVFEICRRGFTVHGNEISWHQIIASNWILNHTDKGERFDLYPFALEFSNVISRSDQLRVVHVPDVHPGSVLEEASIGTSVPCTERLGMTAGDFVGTYSKQEWTNGFNAVITLFFIDTAPNLIKYIETVQNCLKPGGLWINLGPLLWHFEDHTPAARNEDEVTGHPGRENASIEEAGSFELTNEEVLLLIEMCGFDIEMQEIRNNGTGYIHNARSMLQSTYTPSHWVARKRV